MYGGGTGAARLKHCHARSLRLADTCPPYSRHAYQLYIMRCFVCINVALVVALARCYPLYQYILYKVTLCMYSIKKMELVRQ